MAIKKLTDKDGNIIQIMGNPKSGGEGDVYDIEGRPNLVVKIYNNKKRSNKQNYEILMSKIQAMCDLCDDEIVARAGWPQQIVYSKGFPVGFIMNKIEHCNVLHQLMADVDRKEKFLDNNWKYLVNVAYNLAIAVQVLHEKGVVIGDINESNFLIGNRTIAQNAGITNFNNNGIVYCIDCDSFQIITNDDKFLCTVSKPEYFPPELHGKNLYNVVRTQNNDNFGLAVIIYQLLMLGKHPYATLGGPSEVVKAIEGGYFAFGKKAKQEGIKPPLPSEMFQIIYDSLDDKIKELFEKAFSDEIDVIRPSAKDWIEALKVQMDNLVQCGDETHFYNKKGRCIWCEIKNQFGYKPWENKVKLNKNQNSPQKAKNNNRKNHKPIKPSQQNVQIPQPQNTQPTNTINTNPNTNINTLQNTQTQPIVQNVNYQNPIMETVAWIQYQGTISGRLYIYSDSLYFENDEYSAKQLTHTVYFDDIVNIEKDGFLFGIKITYKDGTMDRMALVNRALWIKKIYITLMQGGYELARTSSAFDYMNEQYDSSPNPNLEMEYFVDFPKWFRAKEFTKFCIEWPKGSYGTIGDFIGAFIEAAISITKLMIKLLFKFALKPILIGLIVGGVLSSFCNPNISFDYTGALIILGIILEFIPQKSLPQPKKSIVYLIIAIVLLIFYSRFYNDNMDSNDNKKPSIEQKNEQNVITEQNNKSDVSSPQQLSTSKNIDEIKKEYLNEITKNINNNWQTKLPLTVSNIQDIKIKFKVLKNGQLDSYEIINSSGNNEIDNLAIKTLKESSPFIAFPKEIDNSSVSITYIFNCN